MGILVQSLRTITDQSRALLLKVRYFLIAFTCIGLGILFSIMIDSPESGEFVVSIVVVLALLFIIVNKPLNGLLVWLFFMVFIESWVKIPMGAGIPDLSFSRFAIVFLAIFMLAQAAIGKFRFVKPGWVEVFLVLTIIGIMSAAPRSIAPPPTGVIQSAIALWATPLIGYFFAKNLIQSKEDLHKILWAVALLGFVSGVYAGYEHATGNVLFLKKGVEVTRLYRGGESGIRLIEGLMGSTGNMGRALAVTIPVTFYLFLEHRKSDLTKIFLIAMIVAQFYGIIVAMSRTPWYALLIALFLMQIFYPQFRKVFLAIVFAAAIGLVATWDQVSQSQVANRVNDDNSTLEGREARWASATAMWRRKPIYGWGYGWYERDSGKFRTDGGRTSFEAIESDFLNVLVSAGLVGLVPYILFITAIIVNAMRLFFKARAPDWPGFVKSETIVVCGAVLAVLLICSYTQVNTQPVIKLIVFSVAGATVGSHEYLLRRKIENVNTPTRLRPNMM